MNAIWSIVSNDLKKRRKDPLSFTMWIAIPLLIGGLLTAMSGGQDGPQPVAKLLMVNQDEGLVSQLLSGAFSSENLAGLIKAENSTEAEGRQRMDAGEASAMLLIPAGFSDAVLNETPASLLLLTNPSQRILPGIIEGIIATFVEGIYYLHRVFGEEIKAFNQMIDAATASETLEDLQVANMSVTIKQAIDDLEPYLSPALIEVQQIAEPKKEGQETQINLGLLLFPGMIVMGLFFCAMALADEIWAEREGGTLQRIAASPVSATRFLLAKTATAAITLGGVALVIMCIGFAYNRLPVSLLLPGLAWLIIGGLLLFAMMSVIQIISPTRKAASVISTILIFPMLMMGGSFFPLEAMPKWLANIGQFSPNGYIIKQIQPFLQGTSGVLELASGTLIIVPSAIVLLALVTYRLPVFARSNS